MIPKSSGLIASAVLLSIILCHVYSQVLEATYDAGVNNFVANQADRLSYASSKAAEVNAAVATAAMNHDVNQQYYSGYGYPNTQNGYVGYPYDISNGPYAVNGAVPPDPALASLAAEANANAQNAAYDAAVYSGIAQNAAFQAEQAAFVQPAVAPPVGDKGKVDPNKGAYTGPQQGQVPPQGQYPQQGQMPQQEQYPQQGQVPPQGQYPQQAQMPQQGQYPQQGQVPPQGQYPQQQIPTQGQMPQQGQVAPQGQTPSQSQLPPQGQTPPQGQSVPEVKPDASSLDPTMNPDMKIEPPLESEGEAKTTDVPKQGQEVLPAPQQGQVSPQAQYPPQGQSAPQGQMQASQSQLPPQAQQGQYPQTQAPQGQYPTQTEIPTQGQYAPQGQLPPQGQYPAQTQTQAPQGQYPAQTQTQAPQGQYPTQTQMPTQSQSQQQMQAQGQYPAQTQTQVPQGQYPTQTQMPTQSQSQQQYYQQAGQYQQYAPAPQQGAQYNPTQQQGAQYIPTQQQGTQYTPTQQQGTQYNPAQQQGAQYTPTQQGSQQQAADQTYVAGGDIGSSLDLANAGPVNAAVGTQAQSQGSARGDSSSKIGEAIDAGKGIGTYGFGGVKDGAVAPFNPCLGYPADVCGSTDFCSWNGGSSACFYSFAATTSVIAIADGEVLATAYHDKCFDLTTQQCQKLSGCKWDSTKNRCIGVSLDQQLNKPYGNLLIGGSPHVTTVFLQSIGSIQNGFGVVGTVDECRALGGYYKCKDFLGCEWDGIGCVSKSLTDDGLRDICADFLNGFDCTGSGCLWFGDRCSSPSNTGKFTIPKPLRFRTRLTIIGDGLAKKLHVPILGARLAAPDFIALKKRAIEFFKYEFGADFKHSDTYNGLQLAAATYADTIFFQVLDAEVPFGAHMIPRRNRIIFEKFFVTVKPGFAAVYRGQYANFLGQYSVKSQAGEVLEYGAMHVVDEDENIVFTSDYHYNYPLIANAVGILPLNSEVISTYGYGLMRGASIVVPTKEGLQELDHTSILILGDGYNKAGTVALAGIGQQAYATIQNAAASASSSFSAARYAAEALSGYGTASTIGYGPSLAYGAIGNGQSAVVKHSSGYSPATNSNSNILQNQNFVSNAAINSAAFGAYSSVAHNTAINSLQSQAHLNGAQASPQILNGAAQGAGLGTQVRNGAGLGTYVNYGYSTAPDSLLLQADRNAIYASGNQAAQQTIYNNNFDPQLGQYQALIPENAASAETHLQQAIAGPGGYGYNVGGNYGATGAATAINTGLQQNAAVGVGAYNIGNSASVYDTTLNTQAQFSQSLANNAAQQNVAHQAAYAGAAIPPGY